MDIVLQILFSAAAVGMIYAVIAFGYQLTFATSGTLNFGQGEALVTTGGGKTIPCALCHGPTLQGLGDVPAIAGRHPNYIVRQLWDIQQGTRKGLWSPLMKPIVEHLTQEDMLNIAAYVASQGQ